MPKHWIPENPTFQNYWAIITQTKLPGYFASSATITFVTGLKNSMIVTLSCVAISLPVVLVGAFAFSRIRFPMKKFLYGGIFILYALPYVGLLPAFHDIIGGLGLLDTTLGLILFNLSWSIPFCIWILTAYFLTIPDDLLKAARVDGCSWFGAFHKVALPVAIPGIISVVIIQFIAVWNEFIGALVLTRTLASKTFTVVLVEFIGQMGVDYSGLAAAAIIAIIPAFIFALAFQKYIVKGLTMGAVKE